MNYLGHTFLSVHNAGLLTGNFIADAVKGRPDGKFPNEIVKGIYMHRIIDEYTDKHPVTKEFTSVLRADYGRYAPVLTDVVFDYLLAQNWNAFTQQPMQHFANEVYAKLAPNRPLFPERMQLFYDSMIQYNFLVAYGEEEGITQTLKRLQTRTNSDADFVKSIILIENEKGRLSDLFNEFFMDMQLQLQKLGYQ